MTLPYRKSPRMPGMDYSRSGAFFITFSTYKSEEILGSIDPVSSQMILSPRGQIVYDSILALSDGHLGVTVRKFVVMPNHCHLLIFIRRHAESGTPANELIPRFVSTLKRIANHKCGYNLWHRSYHDHFVRSKDDYLRISDYIDNNPSRWAQDQFHPSRFNQ